MSVIDRLAVSLGRRDEVPNVELAESIVAANDRGGVKDLVENLSNRDKNVQSDCLKTLYEIGYHKPALIAEYWKEFLELLDSRNNRLVWGAMTALDSIASENPKAIHGILPKILDVADRGSVITRDHAVGILIELCAVTTYTDEAFPLLIEQLQRCPTNQLPMYAENAAQVVTARNRDLFINTLTSRLDEVDKESKRKRVEKVIRKLSA